MTGNTKSSSRSPVVGERLLYDHPLVGTLDGRIVALLDNVLQADARIPKALLLELPTEDGVWHLVVDATSSLLRPPPRRRRSDPPEVNARPDLEPAPVSGDVDPREMRCAWIVPSEDPGALFMSPGCWPRLDDPEKPCACPTTAEQRLRDRAEVKRARALHEDLRRVYTALVRVVMRLPGGAQVLKDAVEEYRNECGHALDVQTRRRGGRRPGG